MVDAYEIVQDHLESNIISNSSPLTLNGMEKPEYSFQWRIGNYTQAKIVHGSWACTMYILYMPMFMLKTQ